MITIKQHNTTELTGLGILRDLESFSLQDINEAIEELENNIGAPGTGKKYFGDVWNEKLQVLYSLKKFSSKKSLNDEIRDLKEALINKFTEMYGQSEAWVKVFNMVVRLQNQRKGREFVRDGLIIELKKVTSSTNATTEVGEVINDRI